MAGTVLVVDDSESARASIRRMLEHSDMGLQVVVAKDGAEALPVALSGDVDIVLSDIVMPNLDGIQLLRGIRQQRDSDALPVILVTSVTDTDTRGLGFEAGANDYLSKPFNEVELVSRIQVQLRLKNLQQELRRTSERYRVLGLRDELTGLANRSHLLELCRRELARSRRHKYTMTLIVIDIDRFREVNQRVGELVGDAVISEMGNLVQSNLRATDTLARTGGGRFVSLLPQADATHGRLVSERLCHAVRGHSFPGHSLASVTLSVGCATYPGGRLESVDELMNAAESSLARAKAHGGDRSDAWSELDEAGPNS